MPIVLHQINNMCGYQGWHELKNVLGVESFVMISICNESHTFLKMCLKTLLCINRFLDSDHIHLFVVPQFFLGLVLFSLAEVKGEPMSESFTSQSSPDLELRECSHAHQINRGVHKLDLSSSCRFPDGDSNSE